MFGKKLFAIENLTNKETKTSSDVDILRYRELEAVLNVTSFTNGSSSNPVTLDVKIQSYNVYANVWTDLVIFDTVTCPANGSVTSVQKKIATAGLGTKIRGVYTTAGDGTITDLDFVLAVILKE
ncbi:MAG: hypothetical protein ACUVQP_06865 [Bacteroidales bacterium]